MGDVKLDNENNVKQVVKKSQYFVNKVVIDLADHRTELSEIRQSIMRRTKTKNTVVPL